MIPLRILRSLELAGIVAESVPGGQRLALAGVPGLHWIEPAGRMEWPEWVRWARRVEAKARHVASLAVIVERDRRDRAMKNGDRCEHQLYGAGTVRTLDGKQAKVMFDRDAPTKAQRRVWTEDLRPGPAFDVGPRPPAPFVPQVVA